MDKENSCWNCIHSNVCYKKEVSEETNFALPNRRLHLLFKWEEIQAKEVFFKFLSKLCKDYQKEKVT